MSFVVTTALKKINKLRGRVRVVQGGTSASKTFSILPLLITYAESKPNLTISVVAHTFPNIKRGAFKDFQTIMLETGKWKDWAMNKTDLTYRFANGSRIEFFSADQPDKMRGPRRDILFVNEANNISRETFNQLKIRTSKFAFLDFNPTSRFWVHEEYENDPEASWLTLTYKDNEATPQAVKLDLEAALKKAEYSDYWANWCRVYVHGLPGQLQDTIFTDWSIIDGVPDEAKKIGYALDFGFAEDPVALVDVYYLDGCYLFDERLYQRHLQLSDLVSIMKSLDIEGLGYADSAEPRSIQYLRSAGFKVLPAWKGPDSVRYGIKKLQMNHFYVSRRSGNMIRELNTYNWKRDKEDNILPEPRKGNDHCIDASRYYVQSQRHNKAIVV